MSQTPPEEGSPLEAPGPGPTAEVPGATPVPPPIEQPAGAQVPGAQPTGAAPVPPPFEQPPGAQAPPPFVPVPPPAPAAAPPAPGGLPAAVPQPGVRYDVPQDQKNLAMISTLGMLIVGFISPLVVYLLTSSDPAKRFANDHAREGLNFSIVYFIGWILTGLLSLVLIGLLLIPVMFGWGLWVIIAGAMQANNGEAPHYPLTPKILR